MMHPLPLYAARGLAAALLLTGCHRAPEPVASAPALPTLPVRLATVELQRQVVTEEVMGTVRPRLRASIEAKVSGRIERMAAEAGQRVKKDELVAQLDVREIKARLDQALALRQQAERDLERFANLRQQQAVTQQEYDAVEARHRVAQASVIEAETMLGYARITAPFDGVITRKLAEVGDLAGPGRPLAELEDPTDLRLEADVPEALIARIRLGDRLPIRVAALTNEFEGVVSEIAPAADPNSRTLRVKLDLPATPGLMAGQFGRVAVPVADSQALRVPAPAVVVRGQMELVFVVTNQTAQLRLVKTGRQYGNELELLAGVEAGERVVAEGAPALLDGQPVTVRP